MNDQDRTEAARAMGRARTPKKLEALRENAKKRVYKPLSEETKEKIRAARLAQIRGRAAETPVQESETQGEEQQA